MRPQASEISTVGSISDRAVSLSIDEHSMGHIMSILTDLYSDPEMAIVREYSCNAIDAHRAIGNPAPIEISLPSVLSEYLIIQDFGIGLSVDDIIDTYSKYGASTKRDSDDFVGMLGLGCKSGLTYADQFTVTSVHNGVKVTAAVMKDENGTGHIDIVDTVGTDEPTGTTVKIPTKRGNSLQAKTAEFFQYWDRGTVLVNTQPPKHFTDGEHYKISDTEYLVSSGGYAYRNGRYSYDNNDIIVMGGVPYESNSSIQGVASRRVSFVPMGSVAFTPSRESLHFTKRTEDFLAQARHDMGIIVLDKTNLDLAKAKDAQEAMEIANRHWVYVNSGTKLEWKGKTIPNHFQFSSGSDYKSWFVENVSAARTYSMTMGDAARRTIVTEFWRKSVSPTVKAKLAKYAEDNGVSDSFLLTQENVFTPWIDTKVVPFSDIEAVILPPNYRPEIQGKRRVPKGTYETVAERGIMVESANISGPIVFISPTETGESPYRQRSECLSKLRHVYGESHTIVVIGKNRHDKFIRDYPEAVHVAEQWKADWKARVWSADESILHGIDVTDHDYLLELGKHIHRINDPVWVRVLEAVNNKEAWEAVEKHRQNLRDMEFGIEGRPYQEIFPRETILTNNGFIAYNNKRKEVCEDAVIFINAKYEMRKS